MPHATAFHGCLSLDEVVPIARRIARRYARRAHEADDLTQVALFAYHRAITPEQPTRTIEIHNARAFACRVLRCAILNYYTPSAQFHAEQEDIDEFALPASGGNQLDLLELDDFFDGLERACGARARAVVENLVAPSGACSKAILANVQRKLARRRELRHADPRSRPRGVVGSVRISQDAVRRAMGLSSREWAQCMEDVRAFASSWFSRSATTPS